MRKGDASLQLALVDTKARRLLASSAFDTAGEAGVSALASGTPAHLALMLLPAGLDGDQANAAVVNAPIDENSSHRCELPLLPRWGTPSRFPNRYLPAKSYRVVAGLVRRRREPRQARGG